MSAVQKTCFLQFCNEYRKRNSATAALLKRLNRIMVAENVFHVFSRLQKTQIMFLATECRECCRKHYPIIPYFCSTHAQVTDGVTLSPATLGGDNLPYPSCDRANLQRQKTEVVEIGR